jgi:hypothetical protein
MAKIARAQLGGGKALVVIGLLLLAVVSVAVTTTYVSQASGTFGPLSTSPTVAPFPPLQPPQITCYPPCRNAT